MRVLLVTSAAPERSPFYTTEKRPPLGIGFLISVLREAGHTVSFIDNYLEPTGFPASGYLQQHDVDIVGIHANTICYRDTRRMLNELQSLRERGDWQGKIVVGGPHTSAAPETIPDFVDHIVLGEGEQAILDIVDGTAARVIKAPMIEDLDSLPRPAYDVFARLPYHYTAEWLPVEPVFTMNTSRGCPYHCTFCSVGSIWGRRYKCFSADRVLDDIQYLVREHNAKGIYFREDNFTANHKRVTEFCEQLIRKGIQIKWMCETRVDSLSRELLELMQRSGCTGLYLGLESGSQRLLDFMKKGITLEQSENVIRWCNGLGIHTLASFIVGVPTETEEERQITIDFAKLLTPTTAGFNIFVGIPRSPLYDYVLKNQLYTYIDDVGLVYLPGHDDLVDQFYGGDPRAKIPWPSPVETVSSSQAPSTEQPETQTVKAQPESPVKSLEVKQKAINFLYQLVHVRSLQDFKELSRKVCNIIARSVYILLRTVLFALKGNSSTWK